MATKLLTDRDVRNAKPTAKAYRKRDGEGLFLFVPPSGVRSWQFRYKVNGKHHTSTLGRLSTMSLPEARAEADNARKLVAKGEHLTTVKRMEKAQRAVATANTFESLAARWVAYRARREKWTPDYKDEVEASIRNHLSDLNGLPVSKIGAAMAAPILERAERRAPDMARKVEQRLLAIMDYAVRRGVIPSNPIPRPERKRKGADRKHLPSVLDRADVGEILRDAERADMSRGVRRAHLLAAFTVQRIGEIVPAEWDEIDLRAGTWAIPRERMKRKDAERGAHVVPIPPKLLALMHEWRRADGAEARYVCPAPNRDGPVTRDAVEKLYRRGLGLSGKHSPHSWRSVFSSWARDAGKDADAIEAQLDHVVGNKVAASYDRAKRIELRRVLMTWYETALIAARDGAAVMPLRRGLQSRHL